MELRLGYRQTEIGIVPEDWDIKRIGDIANPVRGSSPRPAGDPKYFNGSFIPWLTVAALTSIPESQLLVVETDTSLTEDGSRFSRILHPETLIIANSGATLGVAKILGIKCCANDGIAALLGLDSEVSGWFLAHYINTRTSYLREAVATGNGQPNLNTTLIRNISVPLPHLTEQSKIAEALSDVDALIESLGNLIAKKRQLRQGVIQELLTARKRLPGFDEEWYIKTVGELFHVSGGVSASRDQLGSKGYCYLHYGDIHTTDHSVVNISLEAADFPKFDVSLSKISSSSLLGDGDVVFVDASEDEEGASKHIVVRNPENIPFISGLHTIVAKAKSNELDPLFRRYCFRTHEVREQFKFYVVGTKVSGISKGNIVKIKLRVPPKSEQMAIASLLEDMDAEIDLLDAKLAKARWIKQGMMQQLLTGTIRLVHPVSNVVPFRANEKPPTTSSKGHNSAINEAVVISVLAKNFGSDQYPLGRKRYTKLSYLLHRHAEGKVEGYLEKAAGPYNPSTKYKGAEKVALSKRYVRSHARDNFSGFVAAEKIADAEVYFSKWYGENAIKWLEQFRFKKNDDLELLTTVDMAMVRLREVGKPVHMRSVKEYIHDAPEWTAKLNRSIFSDENIDMAMKWSRELFEIS